MSSQESRKGPSAGVWTPRYWRGWKGQKEGVSVFTSIWKLPVSLELELAENTSSVTRAAGNSLLMHSGKQGC